MAEFNNTNLADFSGVWVFCEQRQGELQPTVLELISEGRKLADDMGVELCGLLLGDNVAGMAKELGAYGADKVYVCEDPKLGVYTTDAYAKVICDVVMEKKPEIFLMAATNIGRDLGPRCAARLHTGLTADSTHLDVDVDKYVAFLKENFHSARCTVCKYQAGRPQPQDDPSGIRRSPDGYHHLPALPSADGNRSSGRYEEGRLRRGKGKRCSGGKAAGCTVRCRYQDQGA